MAMLLRRIAAFSLALVALFGAVGLGFTQDDSDAAPINDRIDLWHSRPPVPRWEITIDAPPVPKEVILIYLDSRTITTEFPRARKAVLRQVLEMKTAAFAKADDRQLTPGQRMPLNPTAPDIRRAWRQEIVADMTGATLQFQKEAADILCPILVDIITGYLNPDGSPDMEARTGALMILTQLGGSPPAKVAALLKLARLKGVDQATLFMVTRELGQLRIAKAVPDLVKMVKTDNPVLQATAARALGQIGDLDGLEPLLDLLDRAGDSTGRSPGSAREALLAAIEAVVPITRMNKPGDRPEAKVLASLMRIVLSDPDRCVVVAAADAVKKLTDYTAPFDVKDSEEILQKKIEELRRWWLQQPFAREYYGKFFSPE